MWLWLAIKWLVVVAEIIVTLPAVYLAVVAISAIARSVKLARSHTARTDELPRLAVVIPAHNEQDIVGTLLTSLGGIDYPRDRFEVYVIADNCTDDTAGVATRSGLAHALVRTDAERRGKGYALAFAFDTLASHMPAFDAYVVIDADSVVDPGALRAYAAGLRGGPAAVQASNAVLNLEESPATALRWLALSLVNHIRPLGRNGLGANSTLTGNGMCLTAGLLKRQPWRAFGLTEDYQYYLTITVGGERVAYAPGARIRSIMPVSFDEMRTQDVRWESAGEGPTTPMWVWRLLRAGRWRRWEAVMELLAPPLSQLVALVALAIIAALALRDPLVVTLAGLLTFSVLVYVASAFLCLRPPWPIYRALLSAPWFVIWKLWVTLPLRKRRGGQDWVRTARARSGTPT